MGATMLSLQQLVKKELATPVEPLVAEFGRHIAACFASTARAVLFSGSALFSDELTNEILDYHLVVANYEAAYSTSRMAKWNHRLPPNIFLFEYEGMTAKVAILSEADFHSLNRPDASIAAIWARFAQPARLVWSADEDAEKMVVRAVSGAAPTLLNTALAYIEREVDVLDLWQSGFSLSFQAKLHLGGKDRPMNLVERNPQRYETLGRAALHHTRIANQVRGEKVHILPDPERRISAERKRWPAFKRRGKMLSVAQLVKAGFTYKGGVDYLAWKVNRHHDKQITVRNWQRRWPLLGSIVLLPRLWMKSAAG